MEDKTRRDETRRDETRQDKIEEERRIERDGTDENRTEWNGIERHDLKSSSQSKNLVAQHAIGVSIGPSKYSAGLQATYPWSFASRWSLGSWDSWFTLTKSSNTTFLKDDGINQIKF